MEVKASLQIAIFKINRLGPKNLYNSKHQVVPLPHGQMIQCFKYSITFRPNLCKILYTNSIIILPRIKNFDSIFCAYSDRILKLKLGHTTLTHFHFFSS